MSQKQFVVSTSHLFAKGDAQTALHQAAAQAAQHSFGKKVFIRGVVEISNYCRENCSYCGMRRDNKQLHRFRTDPRQIANHLIQNAPGSITDLNIQAGEDPVAVREVAIPLIKLLKKETSWGISVCLGSLSPSLYIELQEAGASIYIIKFEMANRARYQTSSAPGNYDERLQHIRHLAAAGWHVSSGFIAGLPGQTPEEMLENFQLAAELPLAGCSVSPFIPGDETPLANESKADIELTLNSMAALRLMRPDWVIPAVSALNIAQPDGGYRRGLGTGANLVTINLTPSDIRGDYLLYKRDRFIMTEERILSAMESEGLTPSKQSLAEFYQHRISQNGVSHPQVNGHNSPARIFHEQR